MTPQVFAFAKVPDDDARQKVYEAIKTGKSRFGMWDQEASLRDEYHGANGFLLRIEPGDWIVHVNSPTYGQCVAVQAVGTYDFDEGIECSYGRDFNNFIPIDPATILEFDRNDPNVLPSVNLAPMRRGQRILQVEDFLRSLENLRTNRHSEVPQQDRSLIHLREKIEEELLPRVTELIQQMNRSKEFERFLHRIFDAMPNVESIENGFMWLHESQSASPVSVRVPAGDDSIRSFDSLPSEEIRAALAFCGSGDPAVEIARLFGILRLSSAGRERIEAAIGGASRGGDDQAVATR